LQFDFDAQVEKSIERQRRKKLAKSRMASPGTIETKARPSMSMASKLRASDSSSSSTAPVRRSIATPTTTEFTGLRKKPASRAVARRKSSAVTYVGKKTKTKSSKKLSWSRVAWALFFVMSLRLVFMERGVVDYYKMEKNLASKEYLFESTMDDNIQLVEEIHRIKTDKVYQKQVVRDHLGVIAKDEYLVVFAKDQRFISN
jgi:cell division protein FtsB